MIRSFGNNRQAAGRLRSLGMRVIHVCASILLLHANLATAQCGSGNGLVSSDAAMTWDSHDGEYTGNQICVWTMSCTGPTSH